MIKVKNEESSDICLSKRPCPTFKCGKFYKVRIRLQKYFWSARSSKLEPFISGFRIIRLLVLHIVNKVTICGKSLSHLSQVGLGSPERKVFFRKDLFLS